MTEISSLEVLVVEDHSFQREYIANCLCQIGVKQVITATDGCEALAEVDRLHQVGHSLDLVICDLQMPNMDGFEFIRHLAERSFSGSLIILTAMDDSLVVSVTKMVKEYRLKFIGSLQKPLDTKLLGHYIHEACIDKEISRSNSFVDGVTEKDLIDGLEGGGLISYFQPKYKFSDRSFAGVEALARLILPDSKIVMPDRFLYLYNKLNKVIDFELNIYDQGFQLVRKWIEKSQLVPISVNLCANMLDNSDFCEGFVDLVKRYEIPRDLITIEVTEKSFIDNLALSIEFLARLRMSGFNLAVDDFGTGYSSIKQLELLPFNELKIDKSFLIGVELDPQKQAIVQSIGELAQRMNLRTVAEGVETKEAWNIAKRYGYDICQGYYTGRPIPAKDIETLLA